MDPKKINIIQYFLVPNFLKDVHNFLGHVGYYHRFIQDFIKIASPLFMFLGKYVKFSWTPECQHNFKGIKNKLIATPMLRGPNWELTFHIHTNASDTSMGAILGKKEETLFYSIYYINNNFISTDINKKYH